MQLWLVRKNKGGSGRRTWPLSQELEEHGALEAVAVHRALIYARGWQM